MKASWDIEGFPIYRNQSKLFKHSGNWDPKAEMMRLIKRCRKRHIREDILPKISTPKWANYNERLMEFVNKHWNINHSKAFR